MFRSKIKLIALIVTSLIFASFFILFGLFVYYVPEYPVSIAVFKVAYIVAPNKKSFLEFYSPSRRDVNAGFVPPEVNQFLCNKIEVNKNDDEISAIVNFYNIEGSGARSNGCLYKLTESVKSQITDQIIRGLDDNSNIEGKLILLEEVRRGKSLGKGQIIIKENDEPKPQNSSMNDIWIWRNKYLNVWAKPKFQEWWNSNLSWEEKKKINPLEGTNIKVSECCG